MIPAWVSLDRRQTRDPSNLSGRRVGRIFDRRGRWNLPHLSDPLGSPLFGLEQLLHGHGLIEMVLGLSDLFIGDQKPHVGVHQVHRSVATSRVKLGQCDLRGGQALLGRFFIDGQRRLIVASAVGGTRKQRCGQRLCATGLPELMNSSSTELAITFCLPTNRELAARSDYFL